MSFPNVFGSVDTYPKMLARLAATTFFATIGAVCFLRARLPGIDAALAPLAFPIPVLGVDFPLGTVLPAVGMAIISSAFKLHDRVSDLLGIRQRFDVKEILLPMARLTTVPLRPHQVRAVSSRRKKLMRTVFYQYASSSPKAAKIDAHLIAMALHHWSWYWAAIEASVVALLGAVAAAAFHDWIGVFAFLAADVAFFLASRGIRPLCAEKAKEQVEAIVADQARASEIGGVFRAL